MKKVLVLSKEDSQFCKMLAKVIDTLDEVVYKSEHEFPKVIQLVDFIKSNDITEVLMPNPYGNNKRKVCYEKLKEENIKVVTSDRGAFPNTWFFDQGFNYDSKSYEPSSWDKDLTDEQSGFVQKYIDSFIASESSLEKQGKRIGGNNLKKKLGIDNKKTRVIFVPLQRPDDTVIKYFAGFSESISNFVKIIQELESKLNHKNSEFKYVFLIKKHPLETDYFYFNDNDNIGYVNDDTNVYDLIEISHTVVLINSGVGLNSLVYMKPVLAFGDAFYAHNGLATAINNIEQAKNLIENPIYPEKIKVERFVYHLIKNVYSFGKFKTELVKQADGSFRNVTRDIEFKKINWNGEEVVIDKKSVLVVSPLVPYPIYRGNQARIDAFIRWLISHNYNVDLFVLNTSFEAEKSNKIKKELLAAYKGIKNIFVLKDPALEKKYQIKSLKSNVRKDFKNFSYDLVRKNPKNILTSFLNRSEINREVVGSIFTHELMNVKDKLLGNHNDLVNEKKIPLKFIKSVNKKVLTTNYDYIVLNYAKTIPCVEGVVSDKTQIVLDTHDYQSMFLEEDQVCNGKNLHINLERFRENEHFLMGKADTIIAINKNEEDVFKKLLPSKKIVTIPAFFKKPNKGPKFFGFNSHALYVGSISNFNVSGIIWFLENILPTILREIPDFKLTVAGNVGNSKDVDWDKYKDNVNVVGRVDDLTYYYNNSCMVIAPILGGAGMKIKVVEALSFEKAVIGTTKAFDGISYPKSMNKCVVDEPADFASVIIDVCQNQKLRKQFENLSKELYEADHSLNALNNSLLSIFK